MAEENITCLVAWFDQDGFLELLTPIRDMTGLEVILLRKGVRPRALGQKCFWFSLNEKAVEVNNIILEPICVFRDVTHRR